MMKDVLEKAAGYLVAALGLVAGLAWNDAISALIIEIFPIAKNTILAKFVYAIILTILVVVASIYVLNLVKRRSE